jgi:hypothetical protein
MWLSLMKPTLDLAAHLGLHDFLPASAKIEYRRSFSCIRKRLLTDRQSVLQDDEDGVGAERRLRLGGPSPGCPGERLDD